jgi:CRISPR/Cas system-associated endonuclease Cas3-HD
MTSKNVKKQTTPTSPVVKKKESAEEIPAKSSEQDRLGMLVDSMNFLRTEILGMKDRLIVIESKTENTQLRLVILLQNLIS